MRRFFVAQENIKENTARITGEEAHHILDVLRLKPGDKLQLVDGKGKLYTGTILNTQNKSVQLEINWMQKQTAQSNLQITLLQAIPKKNKMDFIVEKATELGVEAVVPLKTSRTIVRLDRAKQLTRRKRWQKIALQTVKQCGCLKIPQIKDVTEWENALSGLDNFDLKLLFCLSEKTKPLKQVLSGLKVKKIAVFIGPEGDFSPQEIAQAEGHGCIPVSLGQNVFKSDTAGIVSLAMLNYELRQ